MDYYINIWLDKYGKEDSDPLQFTKEAAIQDAVEHLATSTCPRLYLYTICKGESQLKLETFSAEIRAILEMRNLAVMEDRELRAYNRPSLAEQARQAQCKIVSINSVRRMHGYEQR